jgi:hypothetical protein
VLIGRSTDHGVVLRMLKVAAIYFLPVSAVGWVLGPIREFWAVTCFGRMTGVLLMLIAMMISPRWVIRRFDVSRALSATISTGLTALGILVAAETTAGVVWVRRLSLHEYLGASQQPPASYR